MKQKKWFHSGTNNCDAPQILRLADDDYVSGVEHGPFRTYLGARQDMIRGIEREIDFLFAVLRNVRRLPHDPPPKTKRVPGDVPDAEDRAWLRKMRGKK